MVRVFANGPGDLGSIPSRVIPNTFKMVLNATLLNTQHCEVRIKDHHHHHIVLVARISLTLSRHSSLSFIALGRSSGQHPVSSHSCWMYVRAGRPAFARPCVGVHKSTSLKWVARSSTHWRRSYRKSSLRVTLNYNCQLYFLLIKWMELNGQINIILISHEY